MQKVAVIGAGGMGKRHSEIYEKLPNAELVAVCDVQLESANELAAIYRAAAFDDVKKMLEEVEVDVVDICVPTSLHLDYIKTAAAAGKHVCCEKPLARTSGQAQEAVRVCEEAGVVLFVAQVLRWFPEFRKLRDLISSGSIGAPVMVRTSRAGKHPQGWDNWFSDPKRSGGVVMDLIIHDFDWLRWCFGAVKRVYARGTIESSVSNTSYALVTLRFESGVIAHVEGSWMKPAGFKVDVEVAGTDGLLSYSNADAVPIALELRDKDGGAATTIIPVSPSDVSPYYLELEHFVTCLEEGRQPDVTPEDGVEAVRVAEAALRSIATGHPVALG